MLWTQHRSWTPPPSARGPVGQPQTFGGTLGFFLLRSWAPITEMRVWPSWGGMGRHSHLPWVGAAPGSLCKFPIPDFCWVEPLRPGDPAGPLHSDTLAAPLWSEAYFLSPQLLGVIMSQRDTKPCLLHIAPTLLSQ